MQITVRFRQFIICLIVIIALGIESRTGLDAQAQVLFLRSNIITREDMVSSQYELQSKRPYKQVIGFIQEWINGVERDIVQERTWKNNTGAKYRCLETIDTFSLIPAFRGLKGRRIKSYDNCYIWRRTYHILYIQDSDGRKRITMSG